MALIKYTPTDPQLKAHQIKKFFAGLMGGLGSGKTHWLLMELFMLMDENRGSLGGMLVPDYNMFYRDIIPSLTEIGIENDVKYTVHGRPISLYFPDTMCTIFIFHSEDHGDSIRGPNLSFGVVNEITMCNEGAMNAFIGRIRKKGAKNARIAMSGTPEGFNWFYNQYVNTDRDDIEIVYTRTMDNPHLADHYLTLLQNSYSKKMLDQFRDGKFVNMNGQPAAWSFDRAKHVKKHIDRDNELPIIVTVDFNVAPMGAVIWQAVRHEKPCHLQALEEISIDTNANTFQLRDVLRMRLEELNPNNKQVILYPDPAGDSSKTSSLYTDIEILEAVTKDIRYKRRIKSVKDCLNSMNAVLDHSKIEISEKCTNFITDMEQCVLLADFTINKKDPLRTHWIDGFKDMCDYEYPIVNLNSKASVTHG